MASGLLLGFDIGGTKSAAIVGDGEGNALAREEFRTAGPKDTVQRLIEAGLRLCGGERPAGCGIACGGPLSSREGLILSPPNLPGWDRVPVVQTVRDGIGVPAALENDANACAVAEWRWGLRCQVDDLVYLTCGTGQGAGIVLGGRLVRGKQDLAGEIGHVRLLPMGPVGYYKAGSVEGLTSGRALGELAKIRLQEPHEPSHLDRLPLDQVTGKEVGAAAVNGDPLAVRVVQEQAGHLGRACAILIDILNPQRISLGSTAQRLGSLLVDGVREAARQEALPAAFENCVIDKAVLGDEIQDLAALAIARDAAEATGH
ncbi:MAG: ROK family protein [Planctomycetes bacterium]|nr:ROK family protein [Planctomycetota bacterium]